jgi:hypothetical protein
LGPEEKMFVNKNNLLKQLSLELSQLSNSLLDSIFIDLYQENQRVFTVSLLELLDLLAEDPTTIKIINDAYPDKDSWNKANRLTIRS